MDKDIDFSQKIKDTFSSGNRDNFSFEGRVIDFLSAKVSDFNKNNINNKVNLNQLKEVYKRGVFEGIRLEKPIGLWAIARVNMFLRMSKGGSVPYSYKKIDKDISPSSSFFIDDGVKDDILFSYEQISEARLESDLFNLVEGQNFDFVNLEEFFEPNFPTSQT